MTLAGRKRSGTAKSRASAASVAGSKSLIEEVFKTAEEKQKKWRNSHPNHVASAFSVPCATMPAPLTPGNQVKKELSAINQLKLDMADCKSDDATNLKKSLKAHDASLKAALKTSEPQYSLLQLRPN